MSIQKIADIAIVCASLVVVGQVGLNLFRSNTLQDAQKFIEPGSTIKDTADLQLCQARKTLVMITASRCHFCTESMPFYKRLVATAQKAGTRVVAVTAEPVEVNKEYLRTNGVLVDTVSSGSANGIAIRATPTLVLVGHDGVVLDSWAGKLSSKWESKVLSAISSGQ